MRIFLAPNSLLAVHGDNTFAHNYEVHSQINASNYFFLNATSGMQIQLVCQALQVFKYLHPPSLYAHPKPASPSRKSWCQPSRATSWRPQWQRRYWRSILHEDHPSLFKEVKACWYKVWTVRGSDRTVRRIPQWPLSSDCCHGTLDYCSEKETF